jgi:hypothetical protein
MFPILKDVNWPSKKPKNRKKRTVRSCSLKANKEKNEKYTEILC